MYAPPPSRDSRERKRETIKINTSNYRALLNFLLRERPALFLSAPSVSARVYIYRSFVPRALNSRFICRRGERESREGGKKSKHRRGPRNLRGTADAYLCTFAAHVGRYIGKLLNDRIVKNSTSEMTESFLT